MLLTCTRAWSWLLKKLCCFVPKKKKTMLLGHMQLIICSKLFVKILLMAFIVINSIWYCLGMDTSLLIDDHWCYLLQEVIKNCSLSFVLLTIYGAVCCNFSFGRIFAPFILIFCLFRFEWFCIFSVALVFCFFNMYSTSFYPPSVVSCLPQYHFVLLKDWCEDVADVLEHVAVKTIQTAGKNLLNCLAQKCIRYFYYFSRCYIMACTL